MRYSKIYDGSISEGPGFRVALFLQGCHIHCPGCYNKGLWDFEGGKLLIDEVVDKMVNAIKHPMITGFSILGGEPLSHENFPYLFNILARVKKETGKSIWIWTGYTFMDLSPTLKAELLNTVDVLVCGPYIESKRDRNLLWAGSSNQVLYYNINHEWHMTEMPTL